MEAPSRTASRHARSPKVTQVSLPPDTRLNEQLKHASLRLLALLFCFLLLASHSPSPMAGIQPAESVASRRDQVSQSENPTALALGKAVERELSGGQLHSYEIALVVGQYLHVVVDQRGIDVVVTLYAPDGVRLNEVDSPNGANGPEPLSWIAATAGVYRLEVRSLEKDAKPGKYEAKIETLRPSLSEDSHRVRAEMKEAEAWPLAAEGTAESLPKAIDKLTDALTEWRAAGEMGKAAQTLLILSQISSSFGEQQKALDYLSQALPMMRQISNRGGEAITLNNIGMIYSDLGDKQKALNHYNQALPIFRQVGDRGGEAITLSNIGLAYSNLGDKQKALDYYSQALAIVRQVSDRGGEAATLNNIGGIYNALGGQQKALDYYNQALSLRRQIGDRGGEAITLKNIGLVYSDLGDKQKALEYCNQALPILRQVGDRSVEAACLRLAATVERDLGKLDEARSHIEAALAIIESIRSSVIGHDLRSSFVDTVQPYYWLCVDILMQMHKERPTGGFDAVALQANERGRARSLLDLLVESRADIRNGVNPDLLAHERLLQQLLAEKKQRYIELAGKPGTEDERAALGKEIDQLNNQYQEVEAEIRARSPKYAALTQPQPLDLKQIQQRVLDNDTLLLEYSIGGERSYLWVVSISSIRSYALPKRAELEPSAKYFSKLASGGGQEEFERAVPVTEDPDYRPYALGLSRTLLGPVAISLGEKRLLIVADGALEYVPFAALPDPAVPENDDPEKPLVPLLVKHEIVSAPSASVIDVLRNELRERKPAPRTAAVLADPVFSANDPRVMNSVKAAEQPSNTEASALSLQHFLFEQATKDASDLGLLRGGGEFVRLSGTRTEANAIESLLAEGQCKKAVDFEANKVTAEASEIGQYRYVHFGTHGLINPKHPALTGLLLSLVNSKGEPVDGFLAASEVYNLKLPAEMVVLSACRTALGTEIRGEGLVGLTRGFMYAGAARVVASLWRVYDAATAELMTNFYRGVLKDGKRPADALRAAQLEMWKQKKYRKPYYWAAFELQGEWR